MGFERKYSYDCRVGEPDAGYVHVVLDSKADACRQGVLCARVLGIGQYAVCISATFFEVNQSID